MQAPKYDVQFLRSEALRSSVAVAAVAGRGKLMLYNSFDCRGWFSMNQKITWDTG